MIYVAPQELHETWSLVKAGLEEVARKIDADWMPEDVYSALKAGVSTLHLGYNNEEYEGFLVLTPTPDYDGMTLFIWCAYSATDNNVLERYWEELEQMGRNIKAKRIRFHSPRKGWAKRFKPVATIYEKEL
jgi:hypothetical protein